MITTTESGYGEKFKLSINGKNYDAWHSLTPGEVDTVAFPSSDGIMWMLRTRDTSFIKDENVKMLVEKKLEKLLLSEANAKTTKSMFLQTINEMEKNGI